jgi:hypothetical protein
MATHQTKSKKKTFLPENNQDGFFAGFKKGRKPRHGKKKAMKDRMLSELLPFPDSSA